jgi:hypothetical protein
MKQILSELSTARLTQQQEQRLRLQNMQPINLNLQPARLGDDLCRNLAPFCMQIFQPYLFRDNP